MSNDDDRTTIMNAVEAVVTASRTAAAGGGLEGYRHMMERIAYCCLKDHGLVRTDEMLREIAASLEALQEPQD